MKWSGHLLLLNRSSIFFIALIGTIWAWYLHQQNINYLTGQTNTIDGMVHTADDASYIVPAYNFKKTGIWKDNSQGVSAYVQRPPLIGIINWGISFFNPQEYNGWQKYISVLLHFLAIICLGTLAFDLFGTRVGIIISSIYALVPVFWGYLFYYISESITPSIFIFLFFGYIRFSIHKKAKWLIFQGFISGLLLLIRPQLGIFLLPFVYSLWIWVKDKNRHQWKVFAVSVLLAFGAFTSWEIRSISISHQIKLHPIYHVTNNSQYRPVHGSFTSLYKTWEHVSPKFHNHMISIWYLSSTPSEFEKNMNTVVSEIPPYVFQHMHEKTFRDLFKRYNQVGTTIHFYEKNGLPVPGETKFETDLRNDVDYWSHRLKKKMPLVNSFIVPFRSAQWMFSKSQLNLKIFQTKYRGLWWMELLRYTCVISISLLTMLSLSQVFNYNQKIFFVTSLTIFGYLFYLFFIQKMNEERYLVPLLPVFLLLGAERIKKTYIQIKSKFYFKTPR